MVLKPGRTFIPLVALTVAALLIVSCGGDGSGNGTPANGADTPSVTEPAATSSTPDDGSPAPQLTPGAIITDESDLTPEQQDAVEAVKQEVLRQPVQESDVEFVSLTARTFSNACLDIVTAGTPEVCAQVITPGYEIVMKYGESLITFRTNADATVARFFDLELQDE